jgi:hypothetical protein
MRTILIWLALLVGADSALGHHSMRATYDAAATADYAGTIESVAWRNPHGSLTLRVNGADGKTLLWDFEFGPPSRALEYGWSREALAKGSAVTVTAFPAKSGGARGCALRIRLSDGRVFENKDPWNAAGKGLY